MSATHSVSVGAGPACGTNAYGQSRQAYLQCVTWRVFYVDIAQLVELLPDKQEGAGSFTAVDTKTRTPIGGHVSIVDTKKMEQRDFEKYVSAAIWRATMKHAAPAGPMPFMTPEKLARLTALLSAGRENVWYNSSDWGKVKEAVKRMDHCECMICKAMGRHSPARVVHHVKHLRDRPDLALSIYDPDTGARQLISVCKDCHEMLHPEAQRQYRPHAAPVTAERWD